MHGRDCHFRPILVVEAEKANELMDKLGYTFDEISQTLLFFMNYIVNYILIPGQIENWFLICDLKNVGIGKLSLFKNILSALSKFRCRVIKNYILNLSGFVRVAASGILSMLGGQSAKKIVIVESDNLGIMQEYILKENLQIKHGGTSPDLIPGENNLFPPVVPTDMCLNSKPFKPYAICEAYVKQWQKEKEEEEMKLKKKNSEINEDFGDLIIEFEKAMNFTKINNNKYKKYEPKPFDNNIIKNFFNGYK